MGERHCARGSDVCAVLYLTGLVNTVLSRRISCVYGIVPDDLECLRYCAGESGACAWLVCDIVPEDLVCVLYCALGSGVCTVLCP